MRQMNMLSETSCAGLTRIAAPKPKLPGHAASYNPPKEYLPTEVQPSSAPGTIPCIFLHQRRTWCCALHSRRSRLAAGAINQKCMKQNVLFQLNLQEEKAEYEQADEEARPDFVPTAFDSLRLVPSYAAFIKERFERCAINPSLADESSAAHLQGRVLCCTGITPELQHSTALTSASQPPIRMCGSIIWLGYLTSICD